MKKETLLTVAVIALLLLNFGTLYFLVSDRPPRQFPGELTPLDRQIVDKLHYNPAQQAKFMELKRGHRDQMDDRQRAYREALRNYFDLLKKDTIVPAQRDSLQAILTGIQQERAAITFRHFIELKALADPEYRKNFDEVLPDLMQVILPKRDRPGPPRN